jgi:hypothetical protein
VRPPALDQAGGLEAIEQRQHAVEQHQVGLLLRHQGHSFLPIARLTDHVQGGQVGQQCPQRPPGW